MGQQQLILLVLATVIVGVAIVVGIRAFTENGGKANADAMMQDAVRMANDAQAAVKKPDPFGGVANLGAITSLGQLGYAVDGTGEYSNLNGTFNWNAGIITAESLENDGTTADQIVLVEVCGLTDANIDGAITRVNGAATSETATTCVP